MLIVKKMEICFILNCKQTTAECESVPRIVYFEEVDLSVDVSRVHNNTLISRND